MSQGYETFGKYILLEKVATGGMAEVYLGRNTGAGGIGKFLAIKRILPQYSENSDFIDMFKDEAKIAVNLSHSNIVSIYEFGIEQNQFFLVMDYVEGKNLRQILNKMKKSGVAFSIEQVLYIIKEVAAGLDHAHRCLDTNTGKPLNIIHRDISPQNMMIAYEGEVKIVDFGIAKAETQLETTRAGTLKGKFGYMSPEQAEGQNVDLRTDIFSLGIVLWELLANDRLFVANNEVNTLRKIRECQIPSLRKINPNIPPELERIVSKALAKDRNLRYQTAAAFHRELSRFLNRQYPDFSSHDFSVFIKTLFAGEILDSRRKMVEYSKIEMKPEVTKTVSTTDKTVVTQSRTFADTGNHDFSADSDSAPRDLGAPQPKKKAENPPKSRSANESKASPKPKPTPPQKKSAAPRPAAPTPSVLEITTDRGEVRKIEQGPIEPVNLRVENTAFREGTFTGSSRSYSGSRRRRLRFSFTPTIITLTVIGLIGAFAISAVYKYMNPSSLNGQSAPFLQSLESSKVFQLLAKYNIFTPAQEKKELASEAPAALKVTHDIVVTSSPSGATILINGQPAREVTPARIPFTEGDTVHITIQMDGYVPHEEQVVVAGTRMISAVLREVNVGYLDVIVNGAGVIVIDGKIVAQGSPALKIPVPADRDIVVGAVDPVTKASAYTRIRIAKGSHKRVTLSPRASR